MTFTPLCQFSRFYASSVGKKFVVALTALVLLGFLPVHIIGNLLIFAGPEALNEYAHFLQTSAHGMGVWAFRAILLAAFVIHVVATIQLVRQNRAARDAAYEVKTPQKSTAASRTMVVSGIIILCFVVFHILHFTVRTSKEFKELPEFRPEIVTVVEGKEVKALGEPIYDVYSMVKLGFKCDTAASKGATFFYVLGISLLCMHLSHGVSSVFQTLGLRTRKSAGLITCHRLCLRRLHLGRLPLCSHRRGAEDLSLTSGASSTIHQASFPYRKPWSPTPPAPPASPKPRPIAAPPARLKAAGPSTAWNPS